MQLDRSALAAGVRLVVLDTVGSTNAEALARARAGERGPLWVAALRQTAGRGRRGRSWASEAGNLYATLLLTDPSPPARAPELSFVAALAVHDAVLECMSGLDSRVTLKWPNDLLADGAKIAGVLIEAETLADGRFSAALGIGLNCAHHPHDTSHPATDLAALGGDVPPHRAFRSLSAAMVRRLLQWDRGAGFSAIRRDWLANAAGVGEPIRVRTGLREFGGVFTTLDSMGRLILAAPDGTLQAIGAGEVFSGPAGPERHSGVAP
jgi:BirA family transcriptional regulator, biotin operon repressor / biotin---[acetyl-CoA-carboxylase] ligase